MGDRSPKDKQKKKKQQERNVADIHRARQEKQQRPNPDANPGSDPYRKAG